MAMGTGRKVGAVAVPALMAGMVGLGPADAAGAAEPRTFSGDLTQDGVADRFTLGGYSVGEFDVVCQAKVEPGLPGGGYGPVEAHDMTLAEGSVGFDCPDLAAVADLGGDGVNELLLAWSSGNGCVPDHCEHAPYPDLLAVRDFVQVGRYQAMTSPNSIKTADLNADGLVDVYEDHGNDEPFVSLLNTPSGDLVPGPLRTQCGMATNGLVDLDDDGRLDLLVSVVGPCAPGAGMGPGDVAVVLDDGTVVLVGTEHDTDQAPALAEDVADVNADGHLDIVAKDRVSQQVVAVWLGDGHGHFAPK
jgi:hypothetical protein